MSEERIHQIPMGQIFQFPGGNIREQFENLDEMAESIKTHGIVQPLVVNDVGDGRYTLIAGERRLRAGAKAGLQEVPCVVKHLTHQDALELMIVENIQRQELNKIEEARAYRRLLAMPGVTQGDVAKRLGKSRIQVVEYLQLLELPDELQAQIVAGDLGMKAGLDFLRRTKEAPAAVKEKAAKALVDEKPTTRQAAGVIDRVLEKEGVARPTHQRQASTTKPEPPAQVPAPEAAPAAPQSVAAGAQRIPDPDDQDKEAPTAPAVAVAVAQPTQPVHPTPMSGDLREIGGTYWPPAPEGYTAAFDGDGLLQPFELFELWESRERVTKVFMPSGMGGVEIRCPEAGVTIRGRELGYTKPNMRRTERAILMDAGRVIVHCTAGTIVGGTQPGEVYYRAALYQGNGARILRQQIVLQDADNDRHLVIYSSDTAQVDQATAEALIDVLRSAINH